MSDSHDVVIIGGGVTGSATAWSLAASADFTGSILVIERDPTYENAPSARATGGIRQQFSTPENIRMGLYGAEFARNADEHLALDESGTGLRFIEQGYLLLGTERIMPLLEENHRVQSAEGASISLLDRDALKARFPWVNTEELVGASFGERNEGWVDPYTLLQAFRRKARSLGVEYAHDEALTVTTSGGRATSVRLASGRVVNCGVLVNAAGASGVVDIGRQVGIELPIESRLRAAFVFECKTDLSGAPLTILPSGVAWRPEGTRFISNLAPSADNDPERYDHEIDYNQFEQDIWPELAHWIPAFEAIKLVHAWSCHYDYNTLDENAIIDRIPGCDNAFVACGFSGHGLQQSPAVGRALSELIIHGEFRTLDLSGFGFDRVVRGEGIHEINCW